MVEISKICKVAAFLSEADPQGSYALMAFSELPANCSEAACSNHEAHRWNSGDQSAVWRLLLWFAWSKFTLSFWLSSWRFCVSSSFWASKRSASDRPNSGDASPEFGRWLVRLEFASKIWINQSFISWMKEWCNESMEQQWTHMKSNQIQNRYVYGAIQVWRLLRLWNNTSMSDTVLQHHSFFPNNDILLVWWFALVRRDQTLETSNDILRKGPPQEEKKKWRSAINRGICCDLQ